MNRTIEDATVRRYRHDDHAQFERGLADFIAAYNFAKRRNTLNGLTPFEHVRAVWTVWAKEPGRFKSDPPTPGLNAEGR
jgi:hypothetical protein